MAAKPAITATKAPKRTRAKTQHPAIKSVACTPEAPAAAETVPALGRMTLIHAHIEADPNNPRKHFDEEGLDELAASIAQDGLLQNLLVRPVEHGYRLVAGERRWRAIGRAIDKGLVDLEFAIPVDVRQLSDEQAAFLALLENMARKDLKPLEEARHFRLLIDSHGQTTATIAEKTGFTQRFVQQRLSLLELKAGDLAKFERGDMTIEQARQAVANYPKPIEITPAAQVIFLEVAHRIAKLKASNFWTKVPVHYQHAEHPDLAAVREELNNYISVGRSYGTGDNDAAGFHYAGRPLLQQLTGHDEVKLDAVEKALLVARAATGDLRPIAGPYTTPWLNKPYTVNPAVAVESEKRRQQNAAWEERQAREREAREAKVAARKAAAQEALDIVPTLQANEDRTKSLITSFAQRMGAPLPWKYRQAEYDGGLLDANNEPVELNRWEGKELQLLVMAAMNLVTGEEVRITAEALDQSEYLEVMADALLDELDELDEEGARDLARRGLDAFLARQGVAFGADTLRWTEAAAEAVADEIVSGELKLPDTADDAEPDPEITPALARLAGVKGAAAQPVEA